MADLTASGLLTRLNTKLRDSTDRTFTSSEKQEFIAAAIDDDYVFKIVRDDTQVTVANQASYSMADLGISEVLAVFIDVLDNGYPELVSRDGYDVIDGVLYFEPSHRAIPAGKTLIIVGKQKLTTSDTIPEFLQNYVLELALVQSYEELAHTYTTRFLKNDVTLGEILGAIRSMQAKIGDMRRTLANRREVVG